MLYTSVQIVQEDKREITNILESCYDELKILLNFFNSIGLYIFVSEFKTFEFNFIEFFEFYFIEFRFIRQTIWGLI